MRLAMATGRLDVDAVLAGMSAQQIAEWEAFERIEGGFGERAAWERMAHMLALYAETHRDTKKRSQPFRAADFLPWVVAQPSHGARQLRARLTPFLKKKG